LLESPLDRNTAINKDELNTIIVDVAANLSKAALDKTDAYRIARAEAEWERDPFYSPAARKKHTPVKRKVVPAQLKKLKLTYSGYVEMGGKRVAVINGIEYESGEELQFAGYIIERIEPLQVVIGHRKKRGSFTVPIIEESL